MSRPLHRIQHDSQSLTADIRSMLNEAQRADEPDIFAVTTLESALEWVEWSAEELERCSTMRASA